MLILVSWWCVVLWGRCAEGAVLDPALYLAPSPPFADATNSIPSEKPWAQQSVADTNHGDLQVIPIEQQRHSTTPSSASSSTSNPRPISTSTPISITTAALEASTTAELESMDKAETFWPSFFNKARYGTIHVPLTFGLTGTYGRISSKHADSSTGVSNVTKGAPVGNSYGHGYNNGVGLIGSSYASIADDGSLFGAGKAGLAGTGYGMYPGTRVYGGIAAPGWTGWGNGKWGHYGKG